MLEHFYHVVLNSPVIFQFQGVTLYLSTGNTSCVTFIFSNITKYNIIIHCPSSMMYSNFLATLHYAAL